MNNKQRFRFSTSSLLVQLEFGNVGFRERGKREYVYQGKTSRSKGAEPHMATIPGFKLSSHW